MRTDGHNSRPRWPAPGHSARGAVAILSLALVVGLLTACSGQSTAATSTPTPSLSAGQAGIFLSSQPNAQGGTPTQVPRVTLSAVRASDGKLVWSKSTNGTMDGVASGDGALYAAINSQTSSAPIHTSLLALRLRDGTQLWQQAVDTAELPLAAGNGALYILAVVPSTQQIQVEALSASDGHMQWSAALQGAPALQGTPAATGGLGLGAILDSGTLYLPELIEQPTGGHFQLQALRASDGKVLWTTPPGGLLISPVVTVVSNGAVYTETLEIADPTGRTPPTTSIIAWRADDGTQLWKHPLDLQQTKSVGASSIAASGGAVYVAASGAPQGPGVGPSGQLIALDAKTGSQLWRADAGSYVQGLSASASAIYAASIVYNPLVPSIGPTTAVSAYSPSDGKQLWTHPVPNGILQGLFAATSSGIYLSVITKTSGPQAGPQATSIFDALSLTDGSLQWTYAPGGFLQGWFAATAQ